MKTKRIVSMVLAVIMVIAMFPLSSFANGEDLLTLEELRQNNGAISVEAYNIGCGFVMEPGLYAKGEKSTGDITVEVLERKNIAYKGDTSYFSGFEFDDTAEPVYPAYLEPYSGEFDCMGDGNGYLEEFDYYWNAGWCYTIDDWWASHGADSSYPGSEVMDYNTGESVVLGDVIRWHFTVYGYGADCGFPSNVMVEYMGGNLFIQEDKSDLIFILAAINDYYGNLDTDDVYETALEIAADPLADAEAIEEQEKLLTKYIEDTFFNVSTKAEITMYDGEKVYFSFPETGVGVTVIFADYEGGSLNKVKESYVVTEKNTMSVDVPSDIQLSDGDKIMLWESVEACRSLCKAYVVTKGEF